MSSSPRPPSGSKRAPKARPGPRAAAGGRRSRRRPGPPPPLEQRILLTATLCLLAVGAVFVYSASSARTLLSGEGDGSAYLVRYVVYGGLGLIVMHVLSRRGLEAVRSLSPPLLVVSFGLALAVLVPGVGVSVNGARRWIGAGPLQFQPSELMKLALVLYAARLLSTRPRCVRSVKTLASPLLLIVGAACALIALEPDLGTALVIAFTMAALLFAAGTPLRVMGTLAALGGGLVLLFAVAEPYRAARLTSFLNPWADAAGSGFQAVQGQIALGSGGIFGVGIGQSVQKIYYLPEAHTDFILAVIGEEVGAIGVLGVLFLYGMLGYAGLRTARAAKGGYAKLLAAGLTCLILCQAILNIFVVLGLAPLTGVPLPFISYGGANLMVLLAAMGLLMNLASGRAVHLRAVDRPARSQSRTTSGSDGATDRDRRGRDRRPRRAGAGGRRRAAG